MFEPARVLAVLTVVLAFGATPQTSAAEPQQKWATAWAASVQGPYPSGNPTAQPHLQFVFPTTEAGAKDQTFRLIVRPDIWGKQARVRLSNALGTRPVTFDGLFVGVQLS